VLQVRAEDYFDGNELRNTALRWAVATRMQLDRWEPLVAVHLRGKLGAREAWLARNEHHLAVVAAAHMITASDKIVPAIPGTSDIVRQEIEETRHLLEHWYENQPIFNIKPSPREPEKKSGRAYAARNPDQGPYIAVRWDLRTGPLLTPNVPAATVRGLIGRIEKRALADNPDLAQFLAPSPPSPWGWDEGIGWMPRGGGLKITVSGRSDQED
jgi:hypothetical protein